MTAGVESELVERLKKAADERHAQGSGTSRWDPDSPLEKLLNEAAASLSQLQQRIAEVEAELANARKTPDQHYSDALTAAIAEDGP